MPASAPAPSARRDELLELAYRHALQHGLADLSLRPLAAAVGSSPRVLLYLFGSKDDLVRALLARARQEELALLASASSGSSGTGLAGAGARLWQWLAEPDHHDLLRLWVEAYARSLVEPAGPWAGFAAQTVQDWLQVLAEHQPDTERTSTNGAARRTQLLALLRGALLDLLATGHRDRITTAVARGIEAMQLSQ